MSMTSRAVAGPNDRWPRWTFTLLTGLSLLVIGCGEVDSSDETPPDYVNVVPVTGTVKINGEPLPAVVVTFLPPKWSASNGETDAKGAFALETAGKPGVPPGQYKVAISYLVSADGEPQGLGPRSSIAAPPGMATAKEQLPPEYSDFGRTTLTKVVPAEGAHFDFDIKADLPKITAPKTADDAKSVTETDADPAADAGSDTEATKADPSKADPET